MSKIYKGTLGLIGNTPLVEVVNIEKELGLEATLLVKLEYLNPAGSVKDRIAKAMIEDAEEKGILKEGSVIIEPTSGNTGIGLASIAAAKGYRIILTMPETMYQVEEGQIYEVISIEGLSADTQYAYLQEGNQVFDLVRREDGVYTTTVEKQLLNVDNISIIAVESGKKVCYHKENR